MRQHEIDPWSLLFGVVFLFVSGGYLITHTTDVRLHWLLAVPAALIVLGVSVLGIVTRRMQRSDGSVEGDQRSTSIGDQRSTSTTTGA